MVKQKSLLSAPKLVKGLTYFFLTAAILIFTSCNNPFSPIEDLDKIPESLVVAGFKITMQTYLYRDFMPSTEPEGSELRAIITLMAQNAPAFPDFISGDKLYIIRGTETWETVFYDEIRPSDPGHLNQITLLANNGPKWPVGSLVNVVVRLDIKGQGYKYLKAVDQNIWATY